MIRTSRHITAVKAQSLAFGELALAASFLSALLHCFSIAT